MPRFRRYCTWRMDWSSQAAYDRLSIQQTLVRWPQCIHTRSQIQLRDKIS